VKGDLETHRQILIYTWILVASTVVLFFIGAAGYVYLISAVILALPLIYLALRLRRSPPSTPVAAHWANRLFWYSNSYLALLFAAMAVDSLLR
jgi:protoheme IX farnesyltransferase